MAVVAADRSFSADRTLTLRLALPNQVLRPGCDAVVTIVVTTSIMNSMASKQHSQKARVGSPEESAFLELLRTCDLLSRRLALVLKGADLSPNQYNVLRILRGAPEGLACGEIAGRMITRDPDVTRLLDRLEKRGLIARSRESKDRRMVLTSITPEGLRALAELDQPIQDVHRQQLGHLGRNRLGTLAELLQLARKHLA